MEALSYAQVHDWDNLYLAWRRAARGKRGQAAAAGFCVAPECAEREGAKLAKHTKHEGHED